MKLASLLAIFAAVAMAQAGDVKTAGQTYKNVTELKDIPADQLLPSMQFISAALGVDCNGCHVQNDMSSDEKGAKKTARQMIAMTFAINKSHFNGRMQVTCMTCHRGSERPVSVPTVMETDAPPRSAMAAPPAGGRGGQGGAPQVTADQILEKYIAAVGGADAMRKITSRDMKGKITAAGMDSAIEVITKAPNKRLSISNGQSYTAFDGTSGWLGNTGRPAREMTASESAAAAIDAEFNLPLQIKEMYPQLRRGRPATINGVECDVLTAQGQGKPALQLYFDKNSGLLVRSVRLADTPMGRMPTQIDYADYKELSGVKIPLRWTLARPNGRFTIQINDVKINPPVDDSRFAKPAGDVK